MTDEGREERWRTRVVGLEYHRAGDIHDHPLQWRTHPEHQLEALEGLLTDVGKAGAMLAYHSERNAGNLTRIDGHGRKELDPDETWPVLVTDLTDAEADELLAGMDPLSAEAGADPDKLEALHAMLDIRNEAVLRLLGDVRARAGLEIPPAPSLDDLAGKYGEHDPDVFWPVIRVAVPQDVYAQYTELMAKMEGATDNSKFEALLMFAEIGHADHADATEEPGEDA